MLREWRQCRHAAVHTQGWRYRKRLLGARERRWLSLHGQGMPDAGVEQARRGLWALWRRDGGKGRLWALLQCGEWEDGGCGAALRVCATECATAEGACH